jgi:hypothetical protein
MKIQTQKFQKKENEKCTNFSHLKSLIKLILHAKISLDNSFEEEKKRSNLKLEICINL